MTKKIVDDFFKWDSYMSECISMQVELGVAKKGQLDALEAVQPQRSMHSPMRMETRSILKSLGVRFTTCTLQKVSSKK